LNRCIANEVISGESVAIPDSNLKIPKPFNQSEDKLLLENSVLSTICAGSGTVTSATILKDDVWILS
jgi:hypothetical protein